MKKIDSPTCTFCMIGQQTIEHLFYECFCVKNIWLHVINKWNNLTKQNITLTLKTCILGMCNTNEFIENMPINIIILIVKQYIMHCKYDETELDITGFEHFFKNIIELYSNAYDSLYYMKLKMLF